MSLLEPLAILLVLGAFLSSFVSTAFAVGGGFIMLAILAGIPGAYLGKKLLHRIPERRFRLIFKLVMTCFALRLLHRAWVLF